MPKAILTVRIANNEDVMGDVVRVHESHRDNAKTGHVIRIKANGKRLLAVGRGPKNRSAEEIFMDEMSREKLGIKVDSIVEFEINRANFLEQLQWAWDASDAMPRMASRLALLSVLLGAVGFVLGVVSLL